MSEYSSYSSFRDDMRDAAKHLEAAHQSIDSSENAFAKELTQKSPSEVEAILDYARKIVEHAQPFKDRMKRMLELAEEHRDRERDEAKNKE